MCLGAKSTQKWCKNCSEARVSKFERCINVFKIKIVVAKLPSCLSLSRYREHSLAIMEAYDPVRKAWLKLADMATPSSGLGACTLFGLLYTVWAQPPQPSRRARPGFTRHGVPFFFFCADRWAAGTCHWRAWLSPARSAATTPWPTCGASARRSTRLATGWGWAWWTAASTPWAARRAPRCSTLWSGEWRVQVKGNWMGGC